VEAILFNSNGKRIENKIRLLDNGVNNI